MPSVRAVLEADMVIWIVCVAGLDLQLEVIALATAESDLHAGVLQDSQKGGYRPSLKLVSMPRPPAQPRSSAFLRPAQGYCQKITLRPA